jgi:hypothetical protein
MGALRSSGALRNTLLEYLATRADQAFIKSTKLLGSGSGAAWVQGGNSFGAPGVFGTNDANVINVRTNAITRAQFDLSGNFVPPADNTGQVGTNALRWALIRGAVVTSGDLHLMDDTGKANWVIREAPGKLYAHDLVEDQLYEIPLKPVSKPEGYKEPRRDLHHSAHVQQLLQDIEGFLSEESLARLDAAVTDSGARAAAGPVESAEDEKALFTRLLADVQALLAEHQDKGLGMHEALHRDVHDKILLHLDDVNTCIDAHVAKEAADAEAAKAEEARLVEEARFAAESAAALSSPPPTEGEVK